MARPGGRGELRRAAAGDERAGRRRGGAGRRRGRLARARGARAVSRVRIGLTGPIGCGKSTVARLARASAARVVVDADDVAREVTGARRAGARRRSARASATSCRAADGLARPGGARADRLRRPGGAARPRGDRPPGGPAADPRPRSRLRRPRAPARRRSRRSSSSRAGCAALCDEVWLVDLRPGRPARAAAGRAALPADDAEQRIAAQGDLVERLRPAATRVIDTCGTADAARRAGRWRPWRGAGWPRHG